MAGIQNGCYTLGVYKIYSILALYGADESLCPSLGLASYMYSLDSSTTPMYLSFVASSFEEHSLISSIQIAQSVISEFPTLVHCLAHILVYSPLQFLPASPSSPNWPT